MNVLIIIYVHLILVQPLIYTYNMNFVLAINSKENVHQEILLHNRINVINEIVQVASFGLPILNFLA